MKVKFRITMAQTGVISTDWYTFGSIEEVLKKINEIEEDGSIVACLNDKGESILGGIWTKIERNKR